MAYFWAAALGFSLALYVLLDGFDLGIGILFGLAPGERARRHMMEAVAPVWDGNETWLVIAGGTLFGAFPLAYSILVGAFYLPVIIMLCGLILRGVSFEFRHKASVRTRWIWTAGFFGGSLVASFMQGCAIGAFVQELPVDGQHFTGTVLTWLSPYSVWCGIGLVLGYALLGASWLVLKTHADIRDFGYRIMPKLFVGLAIFLVVAAVWIFAAHMRIATAWFSRPYLLIFLAVGGAAGAGLVHGWKNEIDRLPLPMTMIMFGAAYLTMVLSVLPYMVPFSLTVDQVAAPHASLAFLFWGAGIVILPITIVYTAVVYWIFRGRVEIDTSDDDDDDGSAAGVPTYARKFLGEAERALGMRPSGSSKRSMSSRGPRDASAAEMMATRARTRLSATLREIGRRLERRRLSRSLARSAGRFARSPSGLCLCALSIALVVAMIRDSRRRTSLARAKMSLGVDP